MQKIVAAIRPTLFLFLFPAFLLAQVTGKVLDDHGEPLPYATVYVRNTSNGTVANASGKYQLNVSPGAQEIVFQYIGYTTKVEKITVENKPVILNVRLEPSDLQLNEVVITTEDPAVRIMREVIAKRRYYKNKVKEYACDVYIKGFYKLVDTPKKIMGQEIGNMGGILDSNGTGVLYLSESVSTVYFQTPPDQKKEVMISSIISGNDNGYSLNRSTLTDFDLYEEKLDIEREILSPLADNAFNYYRFKWLGSYTDMNGYTIEKVQVTPKHGEAPTFSGVLYVVDAWWNLAGADLKVTGKAIKQPLLDTMRIQQQFVMIGKPDTWRLLSQITSFKFGLFGIKINGFFNSVFSNYNLEPGFTNKFFSRETFSIDHDATQRDTAYWASIRPVPLTEEEHADYTKKDSLKKIWSSKSYLDSLDRKRNKFGLSNIILGYTWNNSYKHRTVSYPAAYRWVQFNTVQGLVLDLQPSWKLDADARGTKFWRANGNLNYGFSEQKLRGWLAVKRRFESIQNTTLEVRGGTSTEQFNRQNPVGLLVNSLYSLVDERNYLKIYDKTFANTSWSRILIPGISLNASAEWAARKPLANQTSYSWRKGSTSNYTTNAPVPDLENQPVFPASEILVVGADLHFRIGQTYSTYPNQRIYDKTKWPVIHLQYRKAIPNILGSDADFDFIHLQFRQNDLSWGLGGYTDWSAGAGYFLRNKSLSFMDLYHPSGNQTFFGTPDRYNRSFLLLPYYAYATDKPFAEAHAQHHLQGWLLDKIPVLRKLNWKEVVGASVFYADQPSRDPAIAGKLPYWELNAGIENIGFKFFRQIRVDVAWGFIGKNHYRTGVVLGIDLSAFD
jgi:hypothetical protein